MYIVLVKLIIRASQNRIAALQTSISMIPGITNRMRSSQSKECEGNASQHTSPDASPAGNLSGSIVSRDGVNEMDTDSVLSRASLLASPIFASSSTASCLHDVATSSMSSTVFSSSLAISSAPFSGNSSFDALFPMSSAVAASSSGKGAFRDIAHHSSSSASAISSVSNSSHSSSSFALSEEDPENQPPPMPSLTTWTASITTSKSAAAAPVLASASSRPPVPGGNPAHSTASVPVTTNVKEASAPASAEKMGLKETQRLGGMQLILDNQ